MTPFAIDSYQFSAHTLCPWQDYSLIQYLFRNKLVVCHPTSILAVGRRDDITVETTVSADIWSLHCGSFHWTRESHSLSIISGGRANLNKHRMTGLRTAQRVAGLGMVLAAEGRTAARMPFSLSIYKSLSKEHAQNAWQSEQYFPLHKIKAN